MFICFNRAYKGEDTTINKFLLDIFRSAKAESNVFGAFYIFSLESFAKDLVDAVGKKSPRKLKFDFVGGSETYDLNPKVKTTLKDLKGSCKLYNADPDGLMNHNKFFIFESVDFEKLKKKHPNNCTASVPSSGRALYLASANLTQSSLEKHNNAILVPITKEIFEVIEDYYKDLKSEYKKTTPIWSIFTGNKVEDRYKTVKSDRCKVYLYPRRKEDTPKQFTDTLVGVLKNIKHYKHPETNDKCEIYITIAGWYESRIELAETLAELSGPNVDIKVISRPVTSSDEGINMDKAVYNMLKGKATMYFQAEGRKIHSKYMLINAPYASGDSYVRQKLVWTGSPNYSGAAVYSHWEMICKLYDKTNAYDAYLKDFNDLINAGVAEKE